jgi:hypothetical protein
MTRVILLFFILLAPEVEAQPSTTDPYTKFLHSFIFSTDKESRPDSVLVSSSHFFNDKGCIQTMCLIKVEVDSFKKVTHMELSDSADSLFKRRFAQKQHYLDVRSLESYLQTEFKNTSTRVFMIPFSYFIYNEQCSPQMPVSTLRNYNKFQGVGQYGYLLKPISFDVIVHN